VFWKDVNLDGKCIDFARYLHANLIDKPACKVTITKHFELREMFWCIDIIVADVYRDTPAATLREKYNTAIATVTALIAQY